ncbi:MAG: hypothetical protein ACK50Q_03180 [Labrys sp. (in: a-proteobacteria)]
MTIPDLPSGTSRRMASGMTWFYAPHGVRDDEPTRGMAFCTSLRRALVGVRQAHGSRCRRRRPAPSTVIKETIFCQGRRKLGLIPGQTEKKARVSRKNLRFHSNLQNAKHARHFGVFHRRLSHRRLLDPALEAP